VGEPRDTYLATAAAALQLLARDEVRAVWDGPSALAEMDVAALAGHLARSVLQVESFLDADPPRDGEPLHDVVSYYLDGDDLSDRGTPSNVAVRERGAETAAGGHAVLVDRTASSLDRLHTRLADEPADRRIVAFGHPMLLDDYLRSRLVEMVVHVDDLAVSAAVEPPELPEAGVRAAIGVLVGIAIGRIGTTAAMRALARRERASQTLRAF
jgi:hypothetical protein